MSRVLLAADDVALYPAAGRDSHGWALPGGGRPAWAGPGNLQAVTGSSSPQASDRGGHGPHDPAAVEAAVLYLPADARPAEGWTALVRGQRWVLSGVRFVADPRGSGDLDCWVADATAGGQ